MESPGAKKMEEWVIEVDQEVYDELTKICAEMGTTIEKLTEDFIRFCADAKNTPVIEQMIADYKNQHKPQGEPQSLGE